MTTRAMAGGVALAALGVLVQPATAGTCTVDLIHAPDDVRPVIEEWVAAEPRCAVQLSVRVIPTRGGYYVLASDASGRIRERIAPDALTAAVLIASWVADDGSVVTGAKGAPPVVIEEPAPDAATGTTAAVTPRWAMKNPPVTPMWAMENPPVTPMWAMKNPPITPTWAMKTPPVVPTWAEQPAAPAAATAPPTTVAAADLPPVGGPSTYEPVDAPASATPPARRWYLRYAGLAALVQDDGGGLRAEADVRRWRWFELGIAAAFVHTSNGYANVTLDDLAIVVQATRELAWKRLSVRATGGVGLAFTAATLDGMQQSMLSPVIDLQLNTGFRIVGGVEARFGAGLLGLPQTVRAAGETLDRGIHAQIFIGVGYRR